MILVCVAECMEVPFNIVENIEENYGFEIENTNSEKTNNDSLRLCRTTTSNCPFPFIRKYGTNMTLCSRMPRDRPSSVASSDPSSAALWSLFLA